MYLLYMIMLHLLTQTELDVVNVASRLHGHRFLVVENISRKGTEFVP